MSSSAAANCGSAPTTRLTPVGAKLWRVGDDSWSPERASFADFVEGRPQTFIYSGEKFVRRDV